VIVSALSVSAPSVRNVTLLFLKFVAVLCLTFVYLYYFVIAPLREALSVELFRGTFAKVCEVSQNVIDNVRVVPTGCGSWK
jgi:hypothetical protein